jgi:hypothetical protein
MDRSRGAGTAVGSRGFCRLSFYRLSFYRLSFYRLSFCLACVCSAAFAGPDPDTVRVAFVEASAVGPAHVRVLGLSPCELIRMREPSALDGVLSIHVVTNGVTNETPVLAVRSFLRTDWFSCRGTRLFRALPIRLDLRVARTGKW